MLINFYLLIMLAGAGHSSTMSKPDEGITHVEYRNDTSGLQQAVQHTLIITDTSIMAGNRKLRTFAINRAIPPKSINLKLNDKSEIRFVNNSSDVVYLKFSDGFVTPGQPAPAETLFKGAALIVKPDTRKGAEHTYQVYKFEQEGSGAVGSIVVQYPASPL